MRIENSIEIAAPVETVWRLTEDVERTPEITPTISGVERLDDGPLRPGSRARVAQPAQGSRVWTVIEVEPNRRFSWSTAAFGLEMVATHDLEPTATGTRNTLRIELVGRRSRLVGALVGVPIRRALAAENRGLKAAAEALASPAAA